MAHVQWYLNDFHEGSFSRPGADEVVAEFIGAGADTYLLEKQAGHFRVKAYGERISNCNVTRAPTNRDVLICTRAHLSGHSVGHWIEVVDWDKNRPEPTPLFGFDRAQRPSVSLC
ncbi:MAG: hypothetical protein ACOY0T_07720 [Myxococcota bacterium]